MNPYLPTSLGYAAAAAALVLTFAHRDARADDITIDNTPFVSSMSRADVRAGIKRSGPSPYAEWNSQQNEPVRSPSSIAAGQARADYLASRDEVHSLTAEDSGSSYFKSAARRSPTTVMGAPAR